MGIAAKTTMTTIHHVLMLKLLTYFSYFHDMLLLMDRYLLLVVELLVEVVTAKDLLDVNHIAILSNVFQDLHASMMWLWLLFF
jgi:hypothetical protein